MKRRILVLDLLATQTNSLRACVEMFQFIICLLAFPPCDMSTHSPMLLCEETCFAYDKLISHGVCTEMISAVEESAMITKESEPEFLELLYLFEAFNCSNPATY